MLNAIQSDGGMKYQFRNDLLREMAAARLAGGAHPKLSMSRITIGGHARSEGLILVSNNLREFQRIEGLRVDNWVYEPW